MLLLNLGAAALSVRIDIWMELGMSATFSSTERQGAHVKQHAGAELGLTEDLQASAHHGEQGGVEHLPVRLHDVKHLLP